MAKKKQDPTEKAERDFNKAMIKLENVIHTLPGLMEDVDLAVEQRIDAVKNAKENN